MSYYRVSREEVEPSGQRYLTGLVGDGARSGRYTSSLSRHQSSKSKEEAFAARAQAVLSEHGYDPPARARYSPTSARPAPRSMGTSTSPSSSSFTLQKAPPPSPISETYVSGPPDSQYADDCSSSSSDDSSTDDYSSIRPIPQRDDSIGALHGRRIATPPARPSSAASHGSGSGPVLAVLNMEAVGLENLGNTCYMNSVLQCLAATSDLQEHIAQRDILRPQQEPSIEDAFTELMQALFGASAGQVICPSRFVEQAGMCNDRWGSGQQHDAQEFLRSLMDMLHAELNRSGGRSPFKALSGKGTESQQVAEEAWRQARAQQSSVISDVFEGQLQSTLTCVTCGTRSHAFEAFQDLSLPIPAHKRCPCPSIQDCLKAFTDEEELNGEDGHKCERCKSKQPTLKSLRVCRSPPVLVLHLKRFSVNPSAFFLSPFEKDTTPVSLQEDALDLLPYCTPAVSKTLPRPVYDLFGIVCHSGSLAGGHYTADVRKADGGFFGPWVTCNDSLTHAQAPRVKDSKAAYLMFYKQRTV